MSLKKHLRTTFLAGIFAGAPLAVTIFFILWVEGATRQPVRDLTGLNIPFVGIILAILLIYLLGLVVTSLIGRWLIRRLDALLERLPLLRDLYQAWKHISVTPEGREGMFSRVVLVPVEDGRARMLGFTSGHPLPGDAATWCVFVPGAPNPMNGRLLFVPCGDCITLQTTPEEAFKLLLSGGNYVPPEVAAATAGSPMGAQGVIAELSP